MYMEDLDLCYRFQASGWRVLYEPRATASHLKGGSAGSHRGPRLNAAFHYGMFRFYRKFYAPSRPALANLAVYAGIVGEARGLGGGERRASPWPRGSADQLPPLRPGDQLREALVSRARRGRRGGTRRGPDTPGGYRGRLAARTRCRTPGVRQAPARRPRRSEPPSFPRTRLDAGGRPRTHSGTRAPARTAS